MQIDSQAAAATAANVLQASLQFQVKALKQTTDAQSAVATELLTGQSAGPAPTDGRGQLVDISA
ncbi:hypothetical protein [Nitrospirillum sp. BR 11828]|uniref:hypothetical protein n=1 Tax=Nitrospirillum sp. BR 11828 TaxID=3104325 RepID=UPI002ACA36A7|nr:hypothetical protein [Nitrospirillum sp. BR 11828]MDZ5649337.1 hypothetical protein [Nitrospirillum sp. BR 11828]